MDFTQIWSEAIGGGIIAPLISVIALPVLTAIVGSSKRDRRERLEHQLRLDVELARGLGDLAAAEQNPQQRDEFLRMRASALESFMANARRHFDEEAGVIARPDRQYWLLPRPRGIFGVAWSFFAIICALFTIMVLVAGVMTPPTDTDASTAGGKIAIVLFAVLLFAAPMLLFRWLSFISARFGRP